MSGLSTSAESGRYICLGQSVTGLLVTGLSITGLSVAVTGRAVAGLEVYIKHRVRVWGVHAIFPVLTLSCLLLLTFTRPATYMTIMMLMHLSSLADSFPVSRKHGA